VTDHVDSKKRSLNMAAIHSRNTKPELAVRKIVHATIMQLIHEETHQ
jgi:DNA mismatch endonuclease, patch repair protein